MATLLKGTKGTRLVAAARKLHEESGHPRSNKVCNEAHPHVRRRKHYNVRGWRAKGHVSARGYGGDAARDGDASPRSNVAAGAGGRVRRRGLTGGRDHQRGREEQPRTSADGKSIWLRGNHRRCFHLRQGQRCSMPGGKMPSSVRSCTSVAGMTAMRGLLEWNTGGGIVGRCRNRFPDAEHCLAQLEWNELSRERGVG